MGRGTVRVLVAASAIMAVLIVAGLATLATVIVRRASAPPATAPQGRGVAPLAAGPAAVFLLREPAGTRIVAASESADALVLTLQGGGPDRVLVMDAASGRVLRRLELQP